jgi:uncharacterized protein YdiU (UPF0061 family)
VAQWLGVGFIHGVMNTDNVSIAGETIDYGPCAFMDAYHPETVFSSIDQFGRYAYGKQAQIAGWNLARLGEALLPLFSDDTDAAVAQANESLGRYGEQFGAAYLAVMRRKLGLVGEQQDDAALAQAFLKVLADNGTDHTLAFRHLCDAAAGDEAALRGLFDEPAMLDAWLARWQQRLALEHQDGITRRAAMQGANPIYIPRNHRVEAALAAAVERQDYAPFEELLTVLARPFEARSDYAAYAQPPAEDQRVYRTFCGT